MAGGHLLAPPFGLCSLRVAHLAQTVTLGRSLFFFALKAVIIGQTIIIWTIISHPDGV